MAAGLQYRQYSLTAALLLLLAAAAGGRQEDADNATERSGEHFTPRAAETVREAAPGAGLSDDVRPGKERPHEDRPRAERLFGERNREDRARGEGRRPYRDGESSGDFGYGREFRGFGGPPPFSPLTEGSSSKGFLFLDGTYVPPPYEIRLMDDKVSINGKILECQPPQRGHGFRGFARQVEATWRSAVSEITGDLSNDFVVLCFKDQPYVRLDGTMTYDMLKAMTAEGGRAMRQISLREQLPENFDKSLWDQWIERYEAPGDLLQRAAVLTNTYETTQLKAEADMRATRLLNQLSYPLAVGGMVLTVLAIGHLLGGRPHARQRIVGIDASPEMLHSLNWSLLFVAAFSLLDLTWTILAANAGQMHELNPIGSHLVGNPRHLAGFKIGITLPSLALIWLLRKHKRAQVAAWWLCLILTFVTLRWLTFSPLMAPV